MYRINLLCYNGSVHTLLGEVVPEVERDQVCVCVCECAQQREGEPDSEAGRWGRVCAADSELDCAVGVHFSVR